MLMNTRILKRIRNKSRFRFSSPFLNQFCTYETFMFLNGLNNGLNKELISKVHSMLINNLTKKERKIFRERFEC